MTNQEALSLKKGQKCKYKKHTYFNFESYHPITKLIMCDNGLFYAVEFCSTVVEGAVSLDLPNHYDGNVYEPLKIIDHYGLDFYEGNVLKYLLRWRKKDGVKDLEKAEDYLSRLITKNK